MYSFTTVKKPLTNAADEARPVSHAAAATLLATSIYMVHSGAETALPNAPELVTATTAAIIAIEWLQWTAMGRIAKLQRAGDDARATALKWQSAGIGVFQVILYTIAVTGYAAKGGADWSSGWPLFGAIALSTVFAAISFVSKWTSCEAVKADGAAGIATGPKGGTSLDDAIFGRQRQLEAPAKREGVLELRERVARHAERRPAHTAWHDDAGRNTLRDENGRFIPKAAHG